MVGRVPADPGGIARLADATGRRRALLTLGILYAIYFGVIVYCDLTRPEDIGVALAYSEAGIYASDVVDGSPAHAAGLQVGDRVTRLGPVQLHTRLDRFAFHARLRFDEPIPIAWTRQGLEHSSALTVSRADLSFWRTRAGLVLGVMRGVQLAMLVLALVIAWKQPLDFGASVGAWLLASLAVYCVVLPARLPQVWRELPMVVEMGLWLPNLSSISAGAILATFYTVFPQRAPRWRFILASIWGLMLPLLALGAYDQLQTMYAPHEPPMPPALAWLDTPATLLFVSVGALVMVRNYRRLPSETERRRVRVVLVSSCIACLSAGAAVLYWAAADRADMTKGLFSSWPLTIGLLPAAFVPFSFAYAISQHRLFDIGVIIRLGLQYALARRFLLSLIPAIVAVVVIDIYTHPEPPGARLGWYALLFAVGVWIYTQRSAWLERLDRRYFREHYSAQKLLRELADDAQGSGGLKDVLPVVARRIEAALHPNYVVPLLRSEDGRFYETLDSADPRGLRFAAGDKAIRLLAVLGHPLVVGSGAPHSVFDQLPDGERRALAALQTELLVGISGPGDTVEALLALGMKRSEEPFTAADIDLLAAIASNLKSRLPLSATTEECEACGATYPTGSGRCASDGMVLVSSDTPPVLAERYAIERRLGRGGMGLVYSARDLQLNRTVAVKLLRDRLASVGAAERSRREARAAAALEHPNVVTIHDIGMTPDGRPFLVMELLRGRTLREAMASGQMPAASIARVFDGVCGALDAAHATGMVHRDLKPENIFLVNGRDTSDSVKLLDFGISVFVAERGLSRGSGALGTPEYASPEQIRGESPEPSWDLWALAVMAFEAVAGTRPVVRIAMSLAGATGEGEQAWHDPALRGLNSRLVAFFSSALAVDSAARPRTAAEFSARLQEALR
jgi:hypothetical protein